MGRWRPNESVVLLHGCNVKGQFLSNTYSFDMSCDMGETLMGRFDTAIPYFGRENEICLWQKKITDWIFKHCLLVIQQKINKECKMTNEFIYIRK